MGGLKSLYNQFPAAYEDGVLGDFSEGLDQLGRAGFYPGLWANIPLYLSGLQDFDVPPPAQAVTGVESLLGGNTLSSLRDKMFPSKFRTYYQVELASNIAQNRGVAVSGDEIRRKLDKGVALSEEESNIWKEAQRQVNSYQFLFDQTGVFKLDIENKQAAAREVAEYIYQKTGITPEQQDAITTRLEGSGYRLGDLFPLSPTDSEELYNMAKYKYWAGSSNVLRPEPLRKLEDKIQNYWDEVDAINEQARNTGLDDGKGNLIPSLKSLDEDFRAGRITSTEYLDGSAIVNQKKADMIAGLKGSKDSIYKDVPITVEERAAYAKEKKMVLPVDHPEKELLRVYQGLNPVDPKTGEANWEKYFASIDAIIEAMPSDKQQSFLDYLHRNWTPTQILYWETNREYIRPYFALREGVLQSLVPEQSEFIRRFEDASDADIRNLPEGYGDLLTDFNSGVGRARERFRQLDPYSDAWLFYWGKVSMVQSEQARLIYNDLIKRYGGGRPLTTPIDMSKYKGLPPLPIDNSAR